MEQEQLLNAIIKRLRRADLYKLRFLYRFIVRYIP